MEVDDEIVKDKTEDWGEMERIIEHHEEGWVGHEGMKIEEGGRPNF